MDAGKDTIDLPRERQHFDRFQKILPESAQTFLDVHGSLGRRDMSYVHHVCAPELKDSVDAEEPICET